MQYHQSDFRINIIERLEEFKRVYRSNIPCFTQSNINIKELSLDRKSIRKYTDKELFIATQNMALYIEKIVNDQNSNLYEHRGLSKFIEEIKTLLTEYIEINNTIMHTGKYASRIYMNVIQEIHQAMHNKCKEIEQEITNKIMTLYRLQHQETINNLSSSVEKVKGSDINLYAKLKKSISKAKSE